MYLSMDLNTDRCNILAGFEIAGSSDGFISSLFKARVTGTGSLDLQSERQVLSPKYSLLYSSPISSVSVTSVSLRGLVHRLKC